MKRLIPVAVAVAGIVLSSGCGSSEATAPTSASPAGTARPRVLVITTTAGFRHDSIPAARQVLASLASSTGEFTATATEDLSLLSTSSLSTYDAVMFVLTSGELPLTIDQKSALLDFVSSGHGFIGIHSATDTLYGWPEYGRLVGAYFRDHPWTQQGTVIVEDQSHPASSGLGDRFALTEEFYTFQDNPRPRVHVLLRLDSSSVAATGDYPLAWTQSVGAGRVYYNALGHFSSTWNDVRFQRQLTGAIRYAGGG